MSPTSFARLRSQAPPPGPVVDFRLPEVAEDRCGNGMAVRLVESGHRAATAMLVLRVGESAVAGGQAGLAALTGDALEGGTTRRSSRELARALEDVGASFGAATGWDATTVAVSCKAEFLEKAIALLAEMVRTPSFEASDFERRRRQRAAAAVQRAMDPSAMAADAHARFVYASRCAYARPLGGSEASLSALTPADSHAFSAERYGPGQSALVVVGAVEASRAMAAAEEALGGWSRAVVECPEPETAPGRRERAVHVVDRAGAAQAQIRLGHVGVGRAAPDHFPLLVLNLILGGSFSSRLNLNLRERRGFTYGVRSVFAARRGRGPFAVSTAVATDATGAAVREIVREIEALAERGPSGEEVGAAKGYLASVLPLRMESAGQIAAGLGRLVVHDLPTDHYRRYRDSVSAVTEGQVARAARRRLRPEELCTVVVGDARAVVPQLEDAGLGSVTVHGEAGEDRP